MTLLKSVARKIVHALNPEWEQAIKDSLYRKRRPKLLFDFRWEQGPRCPEKRVEAGGAVIGHLVYIFNGYQTIDKVLSRCDIFDLDAKRWVEHFETPADMPQTHNGITTDGERYIFSMGGQYGAHCSPCVNRSYVYDIFEKTWGRLPDLPQPRYIAVAKYWNGRIHVVGGTLPDRFCAVTEHWSIGFKDGKAMESQWRAEVSIPRGGIHRGSVIVDNCLYVVGGSEGDVQPIAGDPNFTCDWKTPAENIHGEIYMLKPGAQSWTRLADMPIPIAHNDTTTIALGNSILVFGGNTSRQVCTDKVYRYNIPKNAWDILGYVPYYMKASNTIYFEGQIFLITGQRSRSIEQLYPYHVLDTVWITRCPQL